MDQLEGNLDLQIFHLQNSRSQRIIWLLEELQIEYSLHFASDEKSKELLATVAPLKFPTLTFQTEKSFYVLSETSAIADFLVSQPEGILKVPPETQIEFLDYVFWKNYADASLMPNVALKQIFAQIKQKTPLPFRPISWVLQQTFNKAYLDAEIHGQLKRINEHLSCNEWIAGSSFTVADILMWFPLEACNCFTLDMDHYSHIQRYLKQIQDRPFFQTALNKGKWSNEEFLHYWNI